MSAHGKSQAAELRAAFVDGHALGFAHGEDVHRSECACRVEAKREAARRYPDPAELRVVRDSEGTDWRYLPDDEGGGVFEKMRAAGAWAEVGTWNAAVPTTALVQLWFDLMEYPFERDGEKRATA